MPLGLALQLPRATLSGIPDGVAGTKATLRVMAGIVKKFKTNIAIRMLSQELTQHLDSYDKVGEISCLHAYVRDEVRYVNDVDGVETLQWPDYTLRVGSGDCDDKSILLASMLSSIGYQCLFYAIGIGGGDFQHVLPGVRLGTRTIPLETIVPGAEPGWMPPDASPVMPWNI